MGQRGIDRCQIILSNACNDSRAKLKLVDKALRLGAEPNRACNVRGSLPFHGYARHGTAPHEASQLMSKGFDPMARDAEGRCFAHHAFSVHNLTMARWVVAACPESWRAKDAKGMTPMNSCCVQKWQDIGNLDCAFKNWAWNALPDECRDAFKDTAWLCLMRCESKQIFGDRQQEALWLSSKNIAINDAKTVLAELKRLANTGAGAAAAKALTPGIMGAIALGEAQQMNQLLGRPQNQPAAGRAPRAL